MYERGVASAAPRVFGARTVAVPAGVQSVAMDAGRYLPFATRVLRHAGPPVHLTLYVTGRCNLRCRHCFHHEEVAAGIEGATLAQYEALAASCERLGPLAWVSIGGGEPFLRRDLAQIGAAFAQRGLRHLAIPTNGLLHERYAPFVDELLPKYPDLHLAVSVSFDGPPAIHDSIRAATGAHEGAKEGVRRLKALQQRHPNLGVGILVCVTRENQDTLAAHMEELVEELQPDNVTVNLARGTALDTSLLTVDVQRYEEVVATKQRLVRTKKLPYFEFPLARLAVARDELMYEHVARVARGEHAQQHLPCTASSLSCVVMENGDVRACEILPDSIGNLNSTAWDLAALWESAAAKELRARIKSTRCACTWECAQADNVLFHLPSWPRLAARMLRS